MERQMHEAQMREEARAREDVVQQVPVREEPVSREPVSAEPVHVEPARAEPVPQPRPQPEPRQPRVNPRDLLESAGLQMVETRPDRAQTPAPDAEAQPLGRPRRERANAPAEEPPLVQVETKQ